MIEITLPIVLQIVQTIGILVGIVYYLTIMRNTQRNQELTLKAQEQALETRQVQLFMNLYETYRSPTFRRQWDEAIFKIEYEDWDDMNQKYNREANYDLLLSWFSVGTFFEGVGVLLKRNLIDISIIDDLLATSIRMAWEKIGPIEIESRKRFGHPRAFDDFEYLYNELMKYHEEHPELKT